MMGHLSPHDCDLVAADLWPAEKAKELRAHAGSCEACAGKLREAESSRAAFLVANPPGTRAPALLEEARPAPKVRWRWLFPLGGVVAAAAALLLLVRPAPTTTRLKGESLSCSLVHEGRELELLGPGALSRSATNGDSLKCTAAPADDRHHLEVWGADGLTAPVRLWSGELKAPGQVPPGSAFAVTGQGEMRLYFVWSDQALAEIAPRLARLPEQPSVEGARIEWLGVVAR